MKRMTFDTLLLLILIFSSCSSKESSMNLNNEVYIESKRFLFVGVPNTVYIENFSGQISDLQLIIDEDTIYSSSSNFFRVSVEQSGIYNLKLYDIKTRKLLAEKIFKSKPFPPLTPYIDNGNPSINKVYTKQLLMTRKLQSELFNWDVTLRCPIVSFSILVMVDGEERKISSNSAELNQKQKELIGLLKSGQHLIITDIVAELPNKTLQKLQPLVYEII